MELKKSIEEIFHLLKEKENQMNGGFNLDENGENIYWQYDVENEDVDLGEIITEAKIEIDQILKKHGFEMVDEYSESNYAFVTIKPKNRI